MAKGNVIRIREKSGRIYVRGRTFPIRGLLREAGLQFDSREGHWWGRVDNLEELLREIERSGIEVEVEGKEREEREGREKATGAIPGMLLDDDFWFLIADTLSELRAWLREDRMRKEGAKNGERTI